MTEDALPRSAADASPPRALWQKTLDRIVDRFGLVEVGRRGQRPLAAPREPCADGRRPHRPDPAVSGEPLFQVVTTNIVVPAIQLDSHMLFAFTSSASAVPHFTLDSVQAGTTTRSTST